MDLTIEWNHPHAQSLKIIKKVLEFKKEKLLQYLKILVDNYHLW